MSRVTNTRQNGQLVTDFSGIPSSYTSADAASNYPRRTDLFQTGARMEPLRDDIALHAATEAAKAQRQAIMDLFPAYAGLVQGLDNAADASRAFQATQDGLLESQQVYTHQISEYSSQVDALTAGRDILLQRQEEGIKLTEEEQALLANYDELYARGTGGVEDATVAQALLAAQYLENMKRGDALNETLEEGASATNDLVSAIEMLILSMDGVPEEVKTQIVVDNLYEAIGGVSTLQSIMNALDGRVVETEIHNTIRNNTINTVQNLGTAGAGRMHGFTAYAHGGTAYDPLLPRFANGGTWALVGEVGPELVKLSRGDQVIPTGGSRAMLQGGRGRGGDIHLHAPVYIYPETGDVRREFTSALVGDWRSG
jgi:hypothetical protein